MPVKNTITQLIPAILSEFISGYQSMFIPFIYLGIGSTLNALPILFATYATPEKPTFSNTFIAASLWRYSRNAFAASACFAFFMTAAG